MTLGSRTCEKKKMEMREEEMLNLRIINFRGGEIYKVAVEKVVSKFARNIEAVEIWLAVE